MDIVGVTLFLANFGEVLKCRSVGGICEAEPKSMKFAKTKRQQVIG
jgi:hypothetical protein